MKTEFLRNCDFHKISLFLDSRLGVLSIHLHLAIKSWLCVLVKQTLQGVSPSRYNLLNRSKTIVLPAAHLARHYPQLPALLNVENTCRNIEYLFVGARFVMCGVSFFFFFEVIFSLLRVVLIPLAIYFLYIFPHL